MNHFDITAGFTFEEDDRRVSIEMRVSKGMEPLEGYGLGMFVEPGTTWVEGEAVSINGKTTGYEHQELRHWLAREVVQAQRMLSGTDEILDATSVCISRFEYTGEMDMDWARSVVQLMAQMMIDRMQGCVVGFPPYDEGELPSEPFIPIITVNETEEE